jgi:hypothetical protein
MKFTLAGLIIIGLLVLLLPVSSMAHGGEKHDPHQDMAMEEPVAGGSIYSAGPDNPPSLDLEEDPLGSSLSRSDLDMEHDPMDAGMPMMQGMDHSGHAESEQTVELAEYELVATSQKGYGLAVVITVLSGLVYGVLILKKPGE